MLSRQVNFARFLINYLSNHCRLDDDKLQCRYQSSSSFAPLRILNLGQRLELGKSNMISDLRIRKYNHR